MFEIGTKAPDFTLPDQDGKEHSLSDYRGKKVILYFYPKDNTEGCTKQACAFGELYPQFQEKGAVVLGVSRDSVASHKSFRKSLTCPSRCFLTRNVRPSKPTASGRKRKITARSPWGSCAVLS